MRKSVIALIDCNNFFVSCERLFNPSLMNRPVAVLSNNDGCLIARSQEIKDLGVPMAAPHFKYKGLLRANNAKILSANFTLYGDISRRITQILMQYSPEIELYSVDEAFLDISLLPDMDHQGWAEEIFQRILREVGVPVCVGVGTTKTLAKLATDRAKRTPKYRSKGGFSLVKSDGQLNAALHKKSLEETPVAGIWGVGRRYSRKLNSYGIDTAAAFIEMPDGWIRKEMSVQGLRTAEELRGVRCLELAQDDFNGDQKMISTGRTFGERIYQAEGLEKAIAVLTARASEKLRRKKQVAGRITVYANSGYKTIPYVSIGGSYSFEQPTNLTNETIMRATDILKNIYTDSRKGFKKAGIIFSELAVQGEQQLSIYRQSEDLDKKQLLYAAVDQLNTRYGKRTVLHASEDWDSTTWHSKNDHCSPHYTTRWDELPVAREI